MHSGDTVHNIQLAPDLDGEASPHLITELEFLFRHEGVERRHTAVSISVAGIFVESANHLALGTLVQGVANLPDGAFQALFVVERVVMPEESAFVGGLPGMGLRFFLLNDNLKEQWETFIDQVRTGSAEIPPDPAAKEHYADSPVRLTRRDNTRRRGRIRVRVRHGERLVDYFTENVSEGGMFIKTAQPLERGERISIFLCHPVSEREFPLEAIVRWVRGDGPEESLGMGVQILEKDEEARTSFLRFMNEG